MEMLALKFGASFESNFARTFVFSKGRCAVFLAPGTLAFTASRVFFRFIFASAFSLAFAAAQRLALASASRLAFALASASRLAFALASESRLACAVCPPALRVAELAATLLALDFAFLLDLFADSVLLLDTFFFFLEIFGPNALAVLLTEMAEKLRESGLRDLVCPLLTVFFTLAVDCTSLSIFSSSTVFSPVMLLDCFFFLVNFGPPPVRGLAAFLMEMAEKLLRSGGLEALLWTLPFRLGVVAFFFFFRFADARAADLTALLMAGASVSSVLCAEAAGDLAGGGGNLDLLFDAATVTFSFFLGGGGGILLLFWGRGGGALRRRRAGIGGGLLFRISIRSSSFPYTVKSHRIVTS